MPSNHQPVASLRLLKRVCCICAFFALPITFAQQPGAVGIGDSLYARLGNGGYDVQHYTIDLVLTPEDNHIAATASIAAVATQDLSRFNLDLSGLDVESVSVNEQPADFDRMDTELVISPSQALENGDAFSVEIAYAGVPEVITDPAVPFVNLGWQKLDRRLLRRGQPTLGQYELVPVQ